MDCSVKDCEEKATNINFLISIGFTIDHMIKVKLNLCDKHFDLLCKELGIRVSYGSIE